MKNPLFFILFFLTIALLLAPAWAQTGGDAAPMAKTSAWMQIGFIAFTENKGQITGHHGKPNDAVKCPLNMSGLNVQLRAGGLSYDAWQEEPVKKKTKETALPVYVRKYHHVDVINEHANQ